MSILDKPSDAPLRDSCAVQELTAVGHDLRIFAESQPFIDSLLADIRTAQHRVWLETYIYVDDAAGRAVAEALKDRAAAGVDVRLMVDAFGSFTTPESLFSDLADHGAQVYVFHRVGDALRRSRVFQVFNRRNHRKLCVVDDRVAYFGGMNIVDQSGIHSAGDAKARGLPVSSGWRDVHLRLVGPALQNVADSMERLWQRMHGVRRRWPKWPMKPMLRADEGIFTFDAMPTFKGRRPARVFKALIRRARYSITLSMAYFIPTASVLRELLRARRRGVRVRVIVPDRSDVRLVRWASRYLCDKLVRRGIRVFERQDQMMHGKLMIVDGETSIIGSCNLDPRSLHHNLEFFAVIRSPEVAEAMRKICAYELAHSHRVDRNARARWWWQRLMDRLAWSVRWWL